ncbi:GNAT family N-acetyltransferase [Methanobacterium sp.]|jgi:predicted GNAT family N-acyltransferase|uniref:GNAT family N-acetyltransferase n=1 Tax=Methanobacterium sp. TaxID=2164 RepID=UPI0031585E64
MIENEKIFMLGCFDMEKLVGAVALMDFCHVSLLFVDTEYQCNGIAKSLFAKALELCIQKNPELGEITVNSSTYAVPIYKKLGFHIAGEPTTNNGITFVPMKMNIIKNNFVTLKK